MFLDVFLDFLDFCEFPVEHVGDSTGHYWVGLCVLGSEQNVTDLINPKKLVPAHHKSCLHYLIVNKHENINFCDAIENSRKI